jgi:hypothetical protein
VATVRSSLDGAGRRVTSTARKRRSTGGRGSILTIVGVTKYTIHTSVRTATASSRTDTTSVRSGAHSFSAARRPRCDRLLRLSRARIPVARFRRALWVSVCDGGLGRPPRFSRGAPIACSDFLAGYSKRANRRGRVSPLWLIGLSWPAANRKRNHDRTCPANGVVGEMGYVVARLPHACIVDSSGSGFNTTARLPGVSRDPLARAVVAAVKTAAIPRADVSTDWTTHWTYLPVSGTFVDVPLRSLCHAAIPVPIRNLAPILRCRRRDSNPRHADYDSRVASPNWLQLAGFPPRYRPYFSLEIAL